MALDQSALLEALDALKAAEVDDRIRQAAQTIYQVLIEAELTAVIGAASYHGNRHGRSTRPRLGGGGMPLGVVRQLLVAQPAGRCTRVASPSTHTASRPRPIPARR